jgi:cell wall assembly regulator SMI1
MTKDVWNTILKHVQTISPPLCSTINPPATEDDIVRLERTLNVHLPEPFCEYLSTWTDKGSMSLFSATIPFCRFRLEHELGNREVYISLTLKKGIMTR